MILGFSRRFARHGFRGVKKIFFFLIFSGTALCQISFPLTKDQYAQWLLHKARKEKQTKPLTGEEIRPRGATLDGRYVVMEKRTSQDPTRVLFYVFDMENKVRSVYPKTLDPKVRSAFLKNLGEQIDFKSENVESVTLVRGESHYEFPDDGQIRRLEIVMDISPNDNGARLSVNEIDELDNVSRLLTYPILEPLILPPRVSRIYWTRGRQTLGFLIEYSVEVDHRSFLKEDVLFVSRNSSTRDAQRVLARENFKLSEAQNNTLLFKDIVYYRDRLEVEVEHGFYLNGTRR